MNRHNSTLVHVDELQVVYYIESTRSWFQEHSGPMA